MSCVVQYPVPVPEQYQIPGTIEANQKQFSLSISLSFFFVSVSPTTEHRPQQSNSFAACLLSSCCFFCGCSGAFSLLAFFSGVTVCVEILRYKMFCWDRVHSPVRFELKAFQLSCRRELLNESVLVLTLSTSSDVYDAITGYYQEQFLIHIIGRTNLRTFNVLPN